MKRGPPLFPRRRTMSGPIDGSNGGTRREFMRGAGVVAGGAALLGANLAAEAQTPKDDAAPKPQVGGGPAPRATGPASDHLDDLGPLRDLGGTWVGRGISLISLPDFDQKPQPKTFRLLPNVTVENLQFTQIGGPIPNRGSKGQLDLNLFGLSYLQRISDATILRAPPYRAGDLVERPGVDDPPARADRRPARDNPPRHLDHGARGRPESDSRRRPEDPACEPDPVHREPEPVHSTRPGPLQRYRAARRELFRPLHTNPELPFPRGLPEILILRTPTRPSRDADVGKTISSPRRNSISRRCSTRLIRLARTS